MKRSRCFLAILPIVGLIVTGCASPMPTGICYTDVRLPTAAAGTGVTATRVGTSRCYSLLGLVARGDASIATAAKNGDIRSISHVDFAARNILGIAGQYTTTVYGD